MIKFGPVLASHYGGRSEGVVMLGSHALGDAADECDDNLAVSQPDFRGDDYARHALVELLVQLIKQANVLA